MVRGSSTVLCSHTNATKTVRKAVFSLRHLSVTGEEIFSKWPPLASLMSLWPDLVHLPTPKATNDERQQGDCDLVTPTCRYCLLTVSQVLSLNTQYVCIDNRNFHYCF